MLNRILNPLNRHNLEKVFTPSTVAKLTYVHRDESEAEMERSLNIPGLQMVLYGPSGCGKTTLTTNMLNKHRKKHVISRCQSTTTMEDLLCNAFDMLNVYYVDEKTNTSRKEVGGSINYPSLYKEIYTKVHHEEKSTAKRALSIQLTPQRLAEFMGNASYLWVIEDFHKVSEEEKRRLADILKIFVDTADVFPKTKIICIGAVATARELVELDKNLTNRIAEIKVSLLKNEEIVKIIEKGSGLMNISIDDSLKGKITYYSNNLASVCHQLCYDMCAKKGVYKTKLRKNVNFTEDDFKYAVQSHVKQRQDTFSKIYDRALTLNLGMKIFFAFDASNKERLGSLEIADIIKRKDKKTIEKIAEQMLILTTVPYDEILRYDRTSEKYFFSNHYFLVYVRMRLAIEDADKEKEKDRKRFSLYTKEQLVPLPTEYFVFDEKLFNETMMKVLESKHWMKNLEYNENWKKKKVKNLPPKKK